MSSISILQRRLPMPDAVIRESAIPVWAQSGGLTILLGITVIACAIWYFTFLFLSLRTNFANEALLGELASTNKEVRGLELELQGKLAAVAGEQAALLGTMVRVSEIDYVTPSDVATVRMPSRASF